MAEAIRPQNKKKKARAKKNFEEVSSAGSNKLLAEDISDGTSLKKDVSPTETISREDAEKQTITETNLDTINKSHNQDSRENLSNALGPEKSVVETQDETSLKKDLSPTETISREDAENQTTIETGPGTINERNNLDSTDNLSNALYPNNSAVETQTLKDGGTKAEDRKTQPEVGVENETTTVNQDATSELTDQTQSGNQIVEREAVETKECITEKECNIEENQNSRSSQLDIENNSEGQSPALDDPIEPVTISSSEELFKNLDINMAYNTLISEPSTLQTTDWMIATTVAKTEGDITDGVLKQTRFVTDVSDNQTSELAVAKTACKTQSQSHSLENAKAVPNQGVKLRIASQLVNMTVSSIEPSVPIVNVREETLSPFTEEQLKTFYLNQELHQVPVFIDQFLQNINRDSHEFYELLITYYKSRMALVKVIQQIETMKNEIPQCIEKVWIEHNLSVANTGQCQDNCTLQAGIEYRQAEYDENKAAVLKRVLKSFRESVHEEFQLKSYNTQLARIRIECFIEEMLKMSSLLRGITSDRPLSAKLPMNLSQDDVIGLRNLQDAITILFSFKRLGQVEEEFCKDVDIWLSTLVSILQRAGALPDYFFILNHVLRCPPGSIESLANNIQFPCFTSIPCEDIWNSPLVHHFVVMLATIALPVKERAKLLMRYKHEMKPTTERSISWTLVDENREEDENPEDSWFLLMENDLVALVDQFPFESLFHYLLKMEHLGGSVSYSVTFSTSNDIIRLLAFASCLVRILGQIFDTYNLLRYRQFVKRISRTIRWIVQIVSDHWCAYRSWRIEICGDSDRDVPKFFTVFLQFSLERLQLEFDQFFTKATEQILNCQSTGALQFLASMPFDAISTNAAWSLLNRLIYTPSNDNANQAQVPKMKYAVGEMTSTGEMIFLFTALSNMAISRSADDREFINCVASSMLEFTFSDDDDKYRCRRDCRDLLTAISTTHPFVMSKLIGNVAKMDDKYLEGCLYLIRALPLDLWFPDAKDLEQLRSWLLGHPLNSAQHQLSRIIISKMNFDTRQDTGALFLPRNYHFTMAVMLVEVYGSCVPDGPGGLKKLEYEDTGILSQVGTFAYQSINKILQSQTQEEFLRWCCNVVLSLKLHANDVETDERSEEERNILISCEESQAQGSGSWFSTMLSTFENFNPEKTELDHCPELLNLKRALSSDGALACYVALMMSKMGHSPEIFLTHGVQVLTKVQEFGWANAVLRVISDVVPLFVKCPDLLHSNPGLLRIIENLVHLDANKAGYTEKILQYPEPGLYSQMLASIITSTVTSTAKRSPELGKVMITCWFKMLAQKSNWHRDYSVLYLMDQLCKAVYMVEGNFQIMVDHFLEQHQSLIHVQSNRGLFSSMMSWMSAGSPITLLEIKKQPEHAYFAYAVLLMEKQYEKNLDIWQKMTAKMALKPSLQVDAAYKKIASRTKASYLPPFHYLNIYRWVDQGLSTSIGHPLLPLIWQQFFMLYLQKQNTAEGLPSRIGVGYRFLDNQIQAALAKKIRSQLQSASSHHQQETLAKEDVENAEPSSPSNIKSHIHDETMHATLAGLYQAMALWIEESRLHDPNLFLDALPEVYKSTELTKIFQGDEEPWLQYVDKTCMEKEMESMGSLWTMSLSKSSRAKHVSREENQQTKATASQRLLKRLNRETKPKSPPALELAESPIPEVSMQLLLTRPRLIQELNDDLERIILFAKKSCVNFDEHTALDGECLELLRDLFANISKHVVRNIPCNRPKNPCSGPAKIILRYEEREVNVQCQRRLEENRRVWENDVKTFLEPLPRSLLVGAVYVESVISKLMKTLQYANPAQKADLENAGVGLFYLLADLINGDVKRNSPAIQFFSSSTEVLGEELIVNNENEQEHLLKTILAEEASVSFLAPHFNPSPNYRSFLHLYSATAELFSESKLTALFVLVSKFDVRTWLTLNPSVSESTFIVRTIVATMEKFGKEPSEDVEMLFGLFRSHMELMLRYRFPQQFREVLTLLYESCQRGTLPFICLQDFNATIGCANSDRCQSPVLAPCQVAMNEAYDAIVWLSGFFSELHKTYHYSTSKLYTAWKVYLPYIARMLPLLFSKLLEPFSSSEFSVTLDKDRYMSRTWNDIFAIYRPWIVPHHTDGSWPTLFVEDSLLLIQSFTESARLVSDLNVYGNRFSFGLNMVWAFYCAEIAGCLRKENALEIYHGLFMTLSWASFCPSIQDLNRMLELYATNVAAFHFLGTIICTLDWPSIVAQRTKYDVENRLREYLIATLRIFIMLSTNKPFMAKTLTQFHQLIESAMVFPWHHVNAQNIAAVCGWYAENCDPISMFEDDSHERTILKLLKTTCYMVRGSTDSPSVGEHTNEIYQKQNAYVRMMVAIITRAAQKSQISLKKLDNIVSTLLFDIEKVARLSSDTQFTELYSAVLLLLNLVTEGPMLDCIEYRIKSYLSESNSASAILFILSAGCRVLAGLDQLVTLSEAAIECLFNRQSDADYSSCWTKVLEVFLVPELNQDQFVRKALSKNCLLTLYAYNLHRFSLCSDSAEELNILKEAFHWCTQVVPSPNICEKYLLLWWQILHAVKRQAFAYTYESQHKQLSQYLSRFAAYCHQISEDKTYSGILGSIGFGKKSAFPAQFRLVARSLYTFILAQLPKTASQLRSFPDAPGHVKAGKSGPANPEAKNALQDLSHLKKNKYYTKMKEDIVWICDFISDSKKCILDGPDLLEYLCIKHYYKVSYIAATVRLDKA